MSPLSLSRADRPCSRSVRGRRRPPAPSVTPPLTQTQVRPTRGRGLFGAQPAPQPHPGRRSGERVCGRLLSHGPAPPVGGCHCH